jgi:hypothetical protein
MDGIGFFSSTPLAPVGMKERDLFKEKQIFSHKKVYIPEE